MSSDILIEQNHEYKIPPYRAGGVPASACAFKRAASLAANERKVFFLHDEGENATSARLQTSEFAQLLDQSEIVAYYRNAPHKGIRKVDDQIGTFRASWFGKSKDDLIKSSNYVRITVNRKGHYFAMIGLGHARRVLELVAKEHGLKESPPSASLLEKMGDYPITILTPTLFTTFWIPSPPPFSYAIDAELPTLDLPNNILLELIQNSIQDGKHLFDFPVPSLQELKEAKKAVKLKHVNASKQADEDRKLWLELKERKERGEDVILPEMPLSGRHRRRQEKLAAQVLEIWGPKSTEEIPDIIDSFEIQSIDSSQEEDPDLISNYVLAPAAEPVTPCAVHLLNEMIQWLELDLDITEAQEPRIDFLRGSILGKTTVGGGTSVDLCKQVVGPRGIGPILEAVGKNSHIDRFLLGNNIVGNEGGKIIADFIRSPHSKRVYNFYIAGNAIGPEGISEIADALTFNNTVTALWLKRNPLLPLGARHLASVLSINTTLQTLDLVNTGIGDEGAAMVLNALRQNPISALRHLYLGCNAENVATGTAIGDYLKTGQSRLHTLFVSSSRLGDEGVAAISEGLKKDVHLVRLGLESVRLGDYGVMKLADALESHPALILLDLGFRKGTLEMGERPNTISDIGLDYLGEKLIGKAGSRKDTPLRLLDLTRNRITKEGAADFVKKYVVDNEKLLAVRISQNGSDRNIEMENLCRKLARERKERYFAEGVSLSQEEQKERDRVREALDPKHIAEIYSIYRGNM